MSALRTRYEVEGFPQRYVNQIRSDGPLQLRVVMLSIPIWSLH